METKFIIGWIVGSIIYQIIKTVIQWIYRRWKGVFVVNVEMTIKNEEARKKIVFEEFTEFYKKATERIKNL